MQGLKYAAVGVVGFCVDGGSLFLLHRAGVDAVHARAFSFPAAVLVTFFLNRTLTFRMDGADRRSVLLTRYTAVQVTGALTNVLIYLGLVRWVPAWSYIPLLPLAIGAAFSWALTYTGSRLVFEGKLR